MDIVERLRSVGGIEGTTRWYINPDGPEAAAEIVRLRVIIWNLLDDGDETDRAAARSALKGDE